MCRWTAPGETSFLTFFNYGEVRQLFGELWPGILMMGPVISLGAPDSYLKVHVYERTWHWNMVVLRLKS